MIQRYRKIFSANNYSANHNLVLYWMSRDQRIDDNHALNFAIQKANETNSSLVIVFNVATNFLNAPLRHFHFMIEGLKELEKKCQKLELPFIVLSGDVVDNLTKFIKKNNVTTLVTDFSPLKISQTWKKQVVENSKIETYEVDAHNIFPVWQISDHQEYMARTMRIKVEKNLQIYLEPMPILDQEKWLKLPKTVLQFGKIYHTDWKKIYDSLQTDESVPPITWLKSGEMAAEKIFAEFLNKKILSYAEDKNKPEIFALSNLSVYLHYGQISAQKIAYEINKKFKGHSYDENVKSFLEELIVRRELSDNYCFYNSNYDNPKGYPNWALASLNNHLNDKREYIYSLEEFEKALTHDDLWNAAQMEMVVKGKMHGYMRMYWCKKILEWTKTYEDAHKIAIYLNDKYSIDGRDPNGYVGVAWSLGGLHDRPWPERKIFGLVRFMSYESLKKKIDTKKYIAYVNTLLAS